MNEQLKKLYNDPEIGFTSAPKFYKKVKEIIPTIKLKDIELFIKSLAITQITKPINTKNRTFNTIISPSVRNNYQIDLFILPYPSQNKGFKYLLTTIDVYSRYGSVEVLKTKTGDVVLTAFKKIIGRMGIPNNLNCDEGSEFIYTPFIQYCKDNNIEMWFSNPEQENKNAVIERWHRTIRNVILKYCLTIGKNSYIDILDKLIKNYNSNEHRTIHAKPVDVWNGKATPNQVITKVDMKFKVGDRVRSINKKATFDKSSSTTNYTIKVYTITKIDGNSIFLDELKKPFKDFELVLAVEDENNNKKAEEFIDKVKEDKKQELIKRRLKREGMADFLSK